MDKSIISLRLNNMSIESLRELYSNHSDSSEKSKHDKKTLISEIVNLAVENEELSSNILSKDISFKPSFYIVSVSGKHYSKYLIKTINDLCDKELIDINSDEKLRGSIRNIERLSTKIEGNIIEIDFIWETPLWYWSPKTLNNDKLYQLNYGYIIIDRNVEKGIICCHNRKELELLIKCLEISLTIKLSSLKLTQPLLDQIGSYDKVKTARYFLSEKNKDYPENITYADDKLSIIRAAIDQEIDPNSIRKQSFYRIPLGSSVDQGVGATSDSGKLWISSETPIKTIRMYSVALLNRISKTINQRIESGDFDTVLSCYNIVALPSFQAINNKELRNDLAVLCIEIMKLILTKEKEGVFSKVNIISKNGVPEYFDYPRIIVEDDVNYSYWEDPTNRSQLVKIKQDNSIISVVEKTELNLKELIHPITKKIVSIDDIYRSIELYPTFEFNKLLNDCKDTLTSHFTNLSKVGYIDFKIHNLSIMIDIERCYSKKSFTTNDCNIGIDQIKEFSKVINYSCADINLDSLTALGEQCKKYNDNDCRVCLAKKERICLRSMIGSLLNKPVILKHKGIELSDIQGEITIDSLKCYFFGFAKIASSGGTLTARNKNGAVLLSQILNQADSSNFDTIMVISPSTINEDLLSRIKLIAIKFNKKLIVLNHTELWKIYKYFIEQLEFDNKEILKDKIISVSM